MTKVKKGFTLAEILITLAIIGVVAAMTIPTLIAKINSIVTENQQKVFKAKVLKGLNLTRTHGDLNNTYSSTYDFLQNGLGKHLKMVKICDASHTRDCVPYDTVTYSPDGTDEETADVKDIDSAEKLGKTKDDGFKDMASFVMGDGTVVIATYKLDCLVDEGKLDKDLGENECFAGIYDLNGSRKPNKMGKDLLGFNGATLKIKKVPVVLATLGGVKIISTPETPTPINVNDYCENEEVKSNYTKYEIHNCCSDCQMDGDYWAGAIMACYKEGGRLPTNNEIQQIFYGILDGNQQTKELAENLGLGVTMSLWNGPPSYKHAAMSSILSFSNRTKYNEYLSRSTSSIKAICVMD